MGETSRQAGAGAPKMGPMRMFMTGNGRPVQPRRTRGFCDAVVKGCLDGEFRDREFFALGFAACLDAVSRGTIDFDSEPSEVVARAWADVNNVTVEPNGVTDIMRAGVRAE